MKKKIIIIVVIVAALALGAAALLALSGAGGAPAVTDSGAMPPPVPVSTQSPVTANIENTMEFIGKVEAAQNVNIIPKLTGEVLNIRVKPGDTVAKGDVLFTLETPDALQNQVDLAALALEMAKINYELTMDTTLDLNENQAYMAYRAAKDAYDNVEEAYDDLVGNKSQQIKLMQEQIELARMAYESEVQSLSGSTDPGTGHRLLEQAYYSALAAWQADPTNPALEAAMQSAKNDLNRVNELKSAYASAQAALNSYQGSVAQVESNLDSVDRSYESAKLAYESVSGESRKAQEKLAKLQLQQAEMSFNQASQQLSYASVTSPIGGTVLALGVKVNDYASTTAPAAVVGSTSGMIATFGVPDRYYKHITLGDLVNLEVGGRTVTASITEISPMVNAQTGLFTIKAAFDNSDGSLLSGVTGKVSVVTEKADSALAVPVSCVRYENNQPYVYIAQNGLASKRFVKLGITDEEVYQVLDGLTAADQLITTWHPNLADGVAVSAQ